MTREATGQGLLRWGYIAQERTFGAFEDGREWNRSIDRADILEPLCESSWPQVNDESGEREDGECPEDEPEGGETAFAFAHDCSAILKCEVGGRSNWGGRRGSGWIGRL